MDGDDEFDTQKTTIEPSREPADTAVRQQRMKAWNPTLDPVWVVISFLVLAAVFIPTGLKLIKISDEIVEMSQVYDTHEQDLPCGISSANEDKECTLTFVVEERMEPPVLVYYEITNFYQNHRQYATSRDDAQLLGSTTQSLLSAGLCEPLNKLGNITINPCGLIANTLFNDVITLTSGNDPNGTKLTLLEDGIAWESDMLYKFRQPDGFRYETCDCNDCTCEPPDWSCTDGMPYQDPDTNTCYRYFYPDDDTTQYLYETYPMVIDPISGVENEHFIVWMRIAATSNVRNLYGWIDRPIEKGEELSFQIRSNWDVKSFKGSKALIVTTTGIFGGKNPKFGLTFVGVGGVCACLGFLFGLKHFLHPRKIAHPKYLVYKED